MDKQIHIHLHLGDTVLSLADLFGEVRTALGANTAASAPVEARGATNPPPAVDVSEANTRQFFVAVYDSSRQAFALGHKLYDSESGAESNEGASNYSCTASFTLDLANRRVLTGGPSSGAKRYWAVLKDGSYSLGRDSFTTESALRDRYPDLFAVLVGSEDSDGDVVLSGV